MAFMDELKTRNSPNFGVGNADGGVAVPSFGPQDQTTPAQAANEMLPMFQRVKQMNLDDFKARANFMNDLAIRREGVQNVFDPNKQNVVYQPSGDEAITPFQKAGLNLEGQKIGLEKGKAAEEASTSKAKLDLSNRELALEQQKSNQIYGTKQADMQRKMDEANQRLQVAHDRLQFNINDAAAHAAFNQATRDALEARHRLELAQRDATALETKRVNDAIIAKLQAEMDAIKNPKPVKTEQELITDTAKGTQKSTKTVTKGEPASKVTPQATVPDEVARKAPKGWHYAPRAGGGFTAVQD